MIDLVTEIFDVQICYDLFLYVVFCFVFLIWGGRVSLKDVICFFLGGKNNYVLFNDDFLKCNR